MPVSRVNVVESSQAIESSGVNGRIGWAARMHARGVAGGVNGSILWWLLLRSAQREAFLLCLSAHPTSSAARYRLPCFSAACTCWHIALAEAQSPCMRHPRARRLQCVLAGSEERARKPVYLRFLHAVFGKLKLLLVVHDVVHKPPWPAGPHSKQQQV